MTNQAIQRAIISTVIFLSESMDIASQNEAEEIISQLDDKIFDNLYARIILKWVEAIESEEPISYATDIIIEALEGSNWENEFLEILATAPIPTTALYKYYEDLKLKALRC